LAVYLVYTVYEVFKVKLHVALTIDSKLLKEIEIIRGREKRSTFVEYLIEIGLRSYKAQNKTTTL
jgi:metal-responsive CopG/Arc/MetJ family transcriptional regulator